jgi:hypothetical protein
VPRNQFKIESCLRGLVQDHNRRVDLLNQHIGFAVRERATLQQLGRVLFCGERDPDEDPVCARIRDNADLQQLYEGIMAAGYEEEVESLSRVNVNAEAGKQVLSMILAKHHYFTAPPSSLPRLRAQLNAATAPPTDIVDLCSDSDDDDDIGDGDNRVRDREMTEQPPSTYASDDGVREKAGQAVAADAAV